MENFTKIVRTRYPGDSIPPLIEVNYSESDELFIIINEKNETLEVSQCNIPALISMLQSISSGIK